MKDAVLRRIPGEYRQQAVDLKNALWGGYSHSHYSQFGEDVILSSLFRGKRGFFVDVGANHPKRYSNTYLLYRNGWRGINIDPNAEAMSQFRRVRPRDINITAGVARREGALTYHRFSDPAYNTFSEEMANEASRKRWLSVLPAQEVPVRTLASLLHEHMPAGKSVDVFTIDVEGLDLDVLASNDWDTYRPKAVVIEDHTFSAKHPERSKIHTYLDNLGYSLVALLGPSLIFTRNEYQ